MINYKAQFTRISSNRKTGFIPATSTESATCPSTCLLKGGACYARFGRLGHNWRMIDEGKRGGSWKQMCESISNLPRNQVWRHNVEGDLPGYDTTIDLQALSVLVEANKGRRGFTFTHKPVGLSGQALINARAIYAANKKGFAINLSADNIEQADEYMQLGIAPVTVLLSDDTSKAFRTPGGKQVVVCPASIAKGRITCDICQLCTKINRKSIVGFPAHGSGKKMVNELVQLKRKAA